MRIIFIDSKLKKTCDSQNLLVRKHGVKRARLIMKRLTVLRACQYLSNIRDLPTVRCHELKSNRKGQLAVDLDHSFRLIFIPADDPIPYKDNGGLDWTKIQSICIVSIEDYHD